MADSRFGRIVVDGSGYALYLFDIERDSAPLCYGACAAAWPPLLWQVDPKAGGGIDQTQVALVSRKDGSKQVMYNRHPLYHYVGDRSPGEIKCQAVFEYGGGWFVLDASGQKITAR